MPSPQRQRWQEFKKRHPNFERNKLFKSDVGPQWDKYVESNDQYNALAAAAEAKLQAKARELVKLRTSLTAAVKGYEAIIKELEASDKTIRHDYESMQWGSFLDPKAFSGKVRIAYD